MTCFLGQSKVALASNSREVERVQYTGVGTCVLFAGAATDARLLPLRRGDRAGGLGTVPVRGWTTTVSERCACGE